MKLFQNKQILIGSLAVIFLLVLYSFFYLKNRNPAKPPFISPKVEVTTQPIKGDKPKVLNAKQIPMLRPDQGQGIDMTSQIAQNSTGEINKIEKQLPYEKTIKTSNGVNVSIFIPRHDMQDNPWTLNVYTHGIDFNAPKDSEEYKKMQIAFLESVNHIFGALREKGTVPEQIIFQWGDKKYMQDRAKEWLQ